LDLKNDLSRAKTNESFGQQLTVKNCIIVFSHIAKVVQRILKSSCYETKFLNDAFLL